MTIAEYFGDLNTLDLDDIIAIVTDNELDMDTSWCKKYPCWEELQKCCVLAVEQKAPLEFAGRVSCAQIMGDAMALLKRKHRETAPRPWYAVMRSLRENPGPATYKRPISRTATTRSEPPQVKVPEPEPIILDEAAAAAEAASIGMKLTDFPHPAYCREAYFNVTEQHYKLEKFREWLWVNAGMSGK